MTLACAGAGQGARLQGCQGMSIPADTHTDIYAASDKIQSHVYPIPEDPKLSRARQQAFFTMVLKHNLVHADLHPGNILVKASEGEPLHIGFVDAGLATELSPRDQASARSRHWTSIKSALMRRALGTGELQAAVYSSWLRRREAGCAADA